MNKILAILMILVAGIVLWMLKPNPEPVGEWHSAEPDKRLKDVPKKDITPPKVPVYAGKAKDKLKLPDDVKDDPNKYVLTSTKLPNDTHQQTVTTVIDSETGEVQTFTRREPLPWLAVEQTGEIGIGYGFKNGQKAGHLFAREELLQIKAAHLGAGVHLFTDGTNMVELTMAVKW